VCDDRLGQWAEYNPPYLPGQVASLVKIGQIRDTAGSCDSGQSIGASRVREDHGIVPVPGIHQFLLGYQWTETVKRQKAII